MPQFVDQARIEIRAGRGGDGASHFHREKYNPRGGPDGGDGGHGGAVVLVVEPDLRTLLDFRFEHAFAAGDGQPGEKNDRTGAQGDDIVLAVPPGTLVYDDDSGALLADLSEPGHRFVVCRGGRGGRGNARYATPTEQAPIFRELGEPGEARNLRLELKLLAEAALVGYPNVGKSTLISRLSAARPKIADYPFTTLTPNLGVVRVDDRVSYVIADLPGLIEGAAEGRGLGHQFLRHLERAKLVVHLLDLSGYERSDPVTDYLRIREELQRYDPHLADLPELVVGTKVDLPDARELAEIVEEELQKHGVARLYPISAVTGEGLDEFKLALTRAVLTSTVPSVAALRAAAAPHEEPANAAADAAFTVAHGEDGVYAVSGKTVERALAMCDLDNEEAVLRLHHLLTRMGVLRALREAGCGDGDAVRIGDVVLDFQE